MPNSFIGIPSMSTQLGPYRETLALSVASISIDTQLTLLRRQKKSAKMARPIPQARTEGEEVGAGPSMPTKDRNKAMTKTRLGQRIVVFSGDQSLGMPGSEWRRD